MAESKWAVFYGIASAGGGNEGYLWTKMPTKGGTTNKYVSEAGYPARVGVVLVEAENESEAAEAVDRNYGSATQPFLVAPAVELKEVTPV